MYSFDEIKGNNLIINLLQNSIKNDRVNHLYIIDGEKRSGKTMLAKTFAKTLLCEKGSINPCNCCSSCKSFDGDNNPDVFYITNKDNKSIGVDIIREDINENVLIRPFKYKYKVYLIENFNLLTVGAQNAFLKTLEEPPEYAIFLLMTKNYSDLLETILSRSVILKLKPLGKKDLLSYINETYPNENADVLASISNGNIGTIIDIVEDDTFTKKRDDALNIIKDLVTYDLSDTLLLYERFVDYKDDLENFLSYFLHFYRDMLIYKNKKNSDIIIQKDKLNDIINLESKFTEKNLLNKIENINCAIQKLGHNTNVQLTIETLLLKLKEK